MAKSDDIRETLLSNDKLMAELGLQNDPVCQLQRELSHSRLGKGAVASRFAQRLQTHLEGIQWERQINQFNSPVTPPAAAGDSILIGHTCTDGKEYRLSTTDLTQHVLPCGGSGSGKSTVIALIVSQLSPVYPVSFFDHKDEGGRFLKLMKDSVYVPLDKLRWNCLSSSAEQSQYLRYFASQFSRLAALVNVTSFTVQAKLQALCSDKDNLPSLSELATIFKKLAQKEHRNNLFTAARAFDDVAETLGEWSNVREGTSPVPEHNLCVYPLKDLPIAAENFFISLLYKQHMDEASLAGHSSRAPKLGKVQ